MATRPESMGIYADLAAKRAASYDTELEGRVREWIEASLGRSLTGPSFRESLADGTVICELMNKLHPGKIPKIHRSQVMMFKRENFGFFQRACLSLGLLPTETCVFEDVYDDRNMGLFLINIVGLARVTQYQDGYSGPILADAPRPGGPAETKPTHEHKYIPTMLDEAAAVAGKAKELSRYTEHGVIQDPGLNPHADHSGTAPPGSAPKGTGQYIPSMAEVAAQQAGAAAAAGRYTEHGVIMNPGEQQIGPA